MWYEYPIPANFDKQKDIIKELQAWIQSLEKQGLIVGFAFNHYYSNPNEPDELRIRFEYGKEENRKIVEVQLEQEVRKLMPNYIKKERIWNSGTTPQCILQAYEFGSRCTFLAWELMESKRFPEEYFFDFYKGKSGKEIVLKKIPYQFQCHFNHGVMNSLAIPKTPNEMFIHLDLLMDCTRCRTKKELIKWLQKNL